MIEVPVIQNTAPEWFDINELLVEDTDDYIVFKIPPHIVSNEFQNKEWLLSIFSEVEIHFRRDEQQNFVKYLYCYKKKTNLISSPAMKERD